MHKKIFSTNISNNRSTVHTQLMRAVQTLAIILVISISFSTDTVHASGNDRSGHFDVKTETPQACYKAGLDAFNLGRFWKASNIWEQTLEVHAKSLNSKQRKGLRMRIAGAYKELNSNPEANTPEAKGARSYDKGCVAFKNALSLMREKKKDEAVTFFNTTYFALKEAEEFRYLGENINHMMAYSCLHTERLSGGWTYLDKSIKDSPDDPRPLNLKVAYLKKRKKPVKQIINVLNRSLKIDKNQKEVHLTLAKIYASERQYKKAVYHTQIAAGKDLVLARELVKLFPRGDYRDEVQSMITNLAAKESIKKEKERLAKRQALLQKERADSGKNKKN